MSKILDMLAVMVTTCFILMALILIFVSPVVLPLSLAVSLVLVWSLFRVSKIMGLS